MSEDILQELKAELVALRTDMVLIKYSIDKIESQIEFISSKINQDSQDGYQVERL